MNKLIARPPGRNRRSFLRQISATVSALAVAGKVSEAGRFQTETEPIQEKTPTRFQVACMTLPYSRFSLEIALKGIAASGFQFVAWGTRHVEESGQPQPILEVDDPPSKAKELAGICRDLGLTPVLMFSTFGIERDGSVEAHRKRIEQAAAAGIPQVLTFGSTEGGRYSTWIRNLKELGPVARDAGVTLVIKQHGGETATGEATARIIREVGDEGVGINYDAGNVLDYINVDPIQDIQHCVDDIRSFSIKDHRNFPKDEDCGPGFGEIDHYRLLAPVAYTGRTMPLACENIFAPLLPRPTVAEEVDALARRAREFLEVVIRGLQS